MQEDKKEQNTGINTVKKIGKATYELIVILKLYDSIKKLVEFVPRIREDNGSSMRAAANLSRENFFTKL